MELKKMYVITCNGFDIHKNVRKSFFMGFEFGFPNFTFRSSEAKIYKTKKMALHDCKLLINCNIEEIYRS